MARKPNPEAESKAPAVDSAAIAGDFQAASQLASITQAYSEDRDLMNQVLGQAQMAGAFEQFSRTVRTSKLAFVKESKLYQQLKGRTGPNGSELTGTWAEFCVLLGTSVDKVDLDISNLKAFGEEALESMARMGIGYREMRQYRKLPEDQKLALIEVAKVGDKESFLDLAEEIITRHAKEKEELSGQLVEAQAEKLAIEKVLETKSNRINQLERDNQRIKTMPADKAAAALRMEATAMVHDAQGLISGKLRAALEALNDAPDADGKALFMAGMVGQLISDLVTLRDEFNLPDVIGDGTPDWQQWAAAQDAAAGAAQ